jgi:hypothetical protein
MLTYSSASNIRAAENYPLTTGFSMVFATN